MLTAAIAYTHTDLTTGTQGISQAQHLLGPIVYAAFAIGAADDLFAEAAQTAPPELINLLQQFPPQPSNDFTRNWTQPFAIGLRPEFCSRHS
jgi:hypothetical protein